MKSIIFEELLIWSKQNEKAKIVKFSKGINIITGPKNRVGKSTILKSLYHTLGADVPQLISPRLKNESAIFALKFKLGQRSFLVIRDENHFGLFDQNNKLVGKYHKISGSEGFSSKLYELLEFNLKLKNAKNNKYSNVYPEYYFLPFYIDQDTGWKRTWTSFNNLGKVDGYRKNMIEYHLGIRSAQSFHAKEELLELETKEKELLDVQATTIAIRDDFKATKSSQLINTDLEQFKDEVENLISELNDKKTLASKSLNNIKNLRNEILSLEHEISLVETAIQEHEADYKYCESPETPDELECPICASTFKNSITERFEYLDDISYCNSLLDHLKKSHITTREELKAAEDEYSTIVRAQKSIEVIIDAKKGKATVKDLLKSEGIKEILAEISNRLTKLDNSLSELKPKIRSARNAAKAATEAKKKINESYASYMKEYLNALDVNSVKEASYKDAVSHIYETGSELSRIILAQHMSYLNTMKKHNKFVICPLVIDTPNQQEQDSANLPAIYDFTFKKRLDNQQLILAAVDFKKQFTSEKLKAQKGLKLIELDTKYSLLNTKDFLEVNSRLSGLHAKMLENEPLNISG